MSAGQTNDAIAELREAYLDMPIPAVQWGGVIGPSTAADLRARVAASGYRSFDLAHRGRYDVNDWLLDRDLFATLAALAGEISGAKLTVGRARFVRSVRGSYALTRDDQTSAPFPAGSLELTLDFSAAPLESTGGEACYRHRGQTFFIVKPAPLACALVARSPTVFRYDRYISHHAHPSPTSELHRLRLELLSA